MLTDNTFKNRRFFKRQTLTFLKSGIKFTKKTIFDASEYEVSYENIDSKKIISSSVNHGWLALAFLFIVLSFLNLLFENFETSFIFFILAPIIVIVTFLTKKKIISINCYNAEKITLFFSKYNEDEVRSFADRIIEESNKYLFEKYSKVDKDLPIENQLSNLELLLNRDIIDDTRFQELKNQLLGR